MKLFAYLLLTTTLAKRDRNSIQISQEEQNAIDQQYINDMLMDEANMVPMYSSQYDEDLSEEERLLIRE
jgi:agmatine/peptidylarginine deiminase